VIEDSYEVMVRTLVLTLALSAFRAQLVGRSVGRAEPVDDFLLQFRNNQPD
jgi:hypothetical protein